MLREEIGNLIKGDYISWSIYFFKNIGIPLNKIILLMTCSCFSKYVILGTWCTVAIRKTCWLPEANRGDPTEPLGISALVEKGEETGTVLVQNLATSGGYGS